MEHSEPSRAKLTFKSQSDIEAEEMLNALKPTEDAIKQAELQLMILNTMMEVGLL
ncbi:hypothetical protein ABE096_13860 [Robertmurraya massiliosenegalensis]|uniref:hypothetical protein n=1 Tax=Robertmurraya TaxID=2837507 RepID=UPI0039A50CF9